jgi:hypothetical protein
MASDGFETYRRVLEDLASYENERLEKERSMANNMSQEEADRLFEKSSEKLLGIERKPDTIENRFDELPPEKRAAFLRGAAAWFPPEDPKRDPNEGPATYVERCQAERAARERVIRQRALEAYPALII